MPILPIKLLRNLVLVEPAKPTSNILLPETYEQATRLGTVVAIGKGKPGKSGRIPMDVCVGDTVAFGKVIGEQTKVAGTPYLVMREEDIMAVVA